MGLIRGLQAEESEGGLNERIQMWTALQRVFRAALAVQVWYFVRPLLCRSGISTGDSHLWIIFLLDRG